MRCACQLGRGGHGAFDTFYNAARGRLISDPFADDFFGLMRFDISRSWGRVARRLHCAATNQCSAACAGAKFSKSHPNRHNVYPAFPSPHTLADHLLMLRSFSLTHTRAELTDACNPINPDYLNLFPINQASLSLIMVNVSFGGCLHKRNERLLSHRAQRRAIISLKNRLDSHANLRASVTCIQANTQL